MWIEGQVNVDIGNNKKLIDNCSIHKSKASLNKLNKQS